jgi:alpha-N-arabinofuranosidase
MERAGRQMDGLSLHYYTVPGDWPHKGSATEFGEGEWFITLRKALRMEELIRKHGEIMDEFDPDRRVGLIVDEWGIWTDVEPGTNPGFLYQQNSLRDALVAALHLNIFNNHAGRVKMANLAQTVNVLQAVILTEGPKLLLTPTYHVFELYRVHQEGILLPVYVESAGAGGLPALSASASEDEAGRIHLSLTNLDPAREQSLRVELRGPTLSPSARVKGRVLSAGDMRAHNTFEAPDRVAPANFEALRVEGGFLQAELPPMSVAVLEIF